jgi:hypothetical protein
MRERRRERSGANGIERRRWGDISGGMKWY